MIDVLAILTSDWHISRNPPTARSCEVNWIEAMAKPIRETLELGERYECPIIIAGDILDRSNASPGLINWLISELRDFAPIYAIPGQHDLPYHDLERIRGSAYWTLVEAGVVCNIPQTEDGYLMDNGCIDRKDVLLYSFPWGREPKPKPKPIDAGNSDCLHVAVCHHFIWKAGHGYYGAPEESWLGRMDEKLKGYDVAVFGDNHSGFLATGKPTIFNCGTFMRRRISEVDYRPMVGLLHSDGSVEPHYLDISGELMSTPQPMNLPKIVDGRISRAMVKDLKNLDPESLDFLDLLKQAVRDENTSTNLRDWIMGVVNDVNESKSVARVS